MWVQVCAQTGEGCWQEEICVSLSPPCCCCWFPHTHFALWTVTSWTARTLFWCSYLNVLSSSWMKLWLLLIWTSWVWSWRSWVTNRPNTWACPGMGPSSQTTTDTEQGHCPKTKEQGYNLPKLLCVLGFWGQAFCHFPLSAAQPLPLPGSLQGPVSGWGSLTPGIRIGYLANVTVKRMLCSFCWFVMLQWGEQDRRWLNENG